jgi:hypothetical protein
VKETGFNGMVRVTSNSNSIAVAGLSAEYNERRDFLIASNPVFNEADPAPAAELIFRHIVLRGAARAPDGSTQDGYSFVFVLSLLRAGDPPSSS